MGYRVLAEATMLAHFAFLAYVVTGGFLAWRWPRAIWPHLVLTAWGFSTIVFGLDCPLTYVEDWARVHAGQRGLSEGFINHYLTGIIYPERYLGLARALAATVVVASWVGLIVRRRNAAHQGAHQGWNSAERT